MTDAWKHHDVCKVAQATRDVSLPPHEEKQNYVGRNQRCGFLYSRTRKFPRYSTETLGAYHVSISHHGFSLSSFTLQIKGLMMIDTKSIICFNRKRMMAFTRLDDLTRHLLKPPSCFLVIRLRFSLRIVLLIVYNPLHVQFQ